MQHLRRVREEDGPAADEERAVVEPDEDDGADARARLARLRVLGRADDEPDVGEDDGGPGGEELRAPADALREPQAEERHEDGEGGEAGVDARLRRGVGDANELEDWRDVSTG